MTNTKNPSVEACNKLFGEHPEDVISPIKSASDALRWLEEILTTIKDKAPEGIAGYQIKQLASAGAYIASDIGEYVGCQHETMIASLRNAGAAAPEEVAK